MATVGLLLSGATLFLNSLVLLNKADAKSAAILNLLVGALQVIIPFYLLMNMGDGKWELFNTSSIFFFGLTYLYVGFTNLKGLHGTGLGWFSLWVVIMSVLYALVNFIQVHDVVSGLLWVMWAYLWYLFFAGLVLGKKIERYTGVVAMIQSWTTITLPAFLMILGVWQDEMIKNAWCVILGSAIIYFISHEVKAFAKNRRFHLVHQPKLKN
ncbi:AmiS/UreI family transporter [Bacillus sp. EAC]|uniref:AmiS/UreI family transporter n=1 Tax=Bacillus sp. EAC TaxID=1978338 RepID=UPI000B449938|nr:AmiS/UreI family transporter [Bacillus sp. EAC]